MEIPVLVKNRISDILDYQKINHPKQDAICDKVPGEWRKYSTTDCHEIVEKFSLGLLKMGIEKNDKIAIISNNRVEWNFVDLGSIQIGAVIVPLYPNLSQENYYYIFEDAAVKLVFVADQEILKKVEEVRKRISRHIEVFTFDKIDGYKHWTELNVFDDISYKDKLNSIKDSINENDLATIIYTSGTTGIPKGVMLTHKNIVSNITSLMAIMPIGQNHKAISFLPLCHIFERTASYFYLANGTSIYYAESIDKVANNLLEVKPNYFTTVPRLLEKVYEKIMEKGRELHGAKQAIFGWAVNLANNYHPLGNNNLFYRARLAVARKLVFSKWLEALGGEVNGIICGAAALQPRLARIFTAAGIEIVEGYGLTETSPVLTCNRFEKGSNYLGTVGMTIPGVRIKLAENGEILAKGSNVMTGYYNKPEFTNEVIDNEGWFHTGDIGELIEGKFLKITDRVKEIFKLSGGKFVAPQPIENKMKESWFIEQIMVIGENRRFTAALVIPNFSFISKWAKRKKLNISTRIQIVNSDEVKERIWLDIEKYNKDFGKVQQIKKIALVEDDWTVESGELTPTLKLKRRILLKKYADLVERIYDEKLEKHLL